MLNTELKIKNTFKEQVKINLEKSFGGATMMPFRKMLKNESTRVL